MKTEGMDSPFGNAGDMRHWKCRVKEYACAPSAFIRIVVCAAWIMEFAFLIWVTGLFKRLEELRLREASGGPCAGSARRLLAPIVERFR